MTLEKAKQYFQEKNYHSAEQAFKELLRVNLNNVEAILGLGRIAFEKNSYQRAFDLFVRCLHIDANNTEIYLYLAEACSALTQFDKTEQALLSAYRLSPTSKKVLFSISVYYCERGDFNKGEQFLDKLIELDENNVQAFALLVRIKKISLCEADKVIVDKFIQLEKHGKLSTNNKVLLNYSFAELHHSDKNFEQAISYYIDANNLQRQQIEFSVSDIKPANNALLTTFTHSFFKSFEKISPDESRLKSKVDITPIFIVGQPRSGSTLLEQMLIGHKSIVSAGELPHIGSDIIEGIHQLTQGGFPFGCKSLTKDQCSSLALHYLKNLQDISGGKHKFVIDKMPANFQFIGLIKLLIPHAKFIHIIRDPKDVSWSIYRNNFDALEPNFCSQSEIVEFHQLYKKTMLHWQHVLPEDIYDIEYEHLVDAPKENISSLLSFLGLTFEEGCLTFSGENRMIRTLSDTQLRTGIHKRSRPDWLPYEDQLKDMFELLE